MSFTDHKITQFVHRIVDLPDQPNLPADELKARFDSSPEELRQAVNGICDDADALESRVDGIVEGSFAGAVTEALLAPELAAKLNGAATTAAVTAQVSAETTARESADTALDTRVTYLEGRVTNFTQVHAQLYKGNGAASREIYLGFEADVIFIMQNSNRTNRSNLITGGIALQDYPLRDGFFGTVGTEITSDGIKVYENQSQNIALNTTDAFYWLVALH